jgi:hypothetical protein
VPTLQEWEQGRRAPSGAARTLLRIAEKNPDEMNYREIRDYVRKIERDGYDASKYRCAMHARISFPFIGVILGFLGIPSVDKEVNSIHEIRPMKGLTMLLHSCQASYQVATQTIGQSWDIIHYAGHGQYRATWIGVTAACHSSCPAPLKRTFPLMSASSPLKA